ncbi:hypothetical protein [Corynebacterium urogenitale]|nr:hypothetical protein [Corynebacterium urogenitale]
MSYEVHDEEDHANSGDCDADPSPRRGPHPEGYDERREAEDRK